MGNGGKQTLPLRHFFSLTFLCVFPTIWRPVTGYLRPSLPDFYGIYSTSASSTFDALLLISAGTDLVVLTFQLLLDCETVILFPFLFSFFCFFFFSFYRIFQTYFSLLSLVSLTLLPTSTCSTQEVTDILFCSRPFVSLFRVLGLRKKYGLLFGLKDFALIDVLVSWKL